MELKGQIIAVGTGYMIRVGKSIIKAYYSSIALLNHSGKHCVALEKLQICVGPAWSFNTLLTGTLAT